MPMRLSVNAGFERYWPVGHRVDRYQYLSLPGEPNSPQRLGLAVDWAAIGQPENAKGRERQMERSWASSNCPVCWVRKRPASLQQHDEFMDGRNGTVIFLHIAIGHRPNSGFRAPALVHHQHSVDSSLCYAHLK
jgi:hypothetical protein